MVNEYAGTAKQAKKNKLTPAGKRIDIILPCGVKVCVSTVQPGGDMQNEFEQGKS